MVTRNPRWHGSPQAKEANSEDSGKPGQQPVSTTSSRHAAMEAFARHAIARTPGSREEKLEAGKRAHDAVERTTAPGRKK